MSELKHVAIFLDFENLAISADTVYPSADLPLEIEPIVDFASRKGNIAIKKAYADWSKEAFHRYQPKLLEHGFELVHLPETNSQGKNGSDVRLAIDVMENLELYQLVETIVIGSGDSDFIPVIQRVRSRGKEVVTIGFDYSVGRLVKVNSTEFKSLEELLGTPEEDSVVQETSNGKDDTYSYNLIVRYLKVRDIEGAVNLAQFKLDLLRLDSSFSEKKLGYPSFKRFVESFQGTLVDKLLFNPEIQMHEVFFKDISSEVAGRLPRDIQKEAKRFLSRSLRYIKDHRKQAEYAAHLHKFFGEKKRVSLREMAEELVGGNESIKLDVRKFINVLYQAGAFYQVSGKGALLDRPFELHYAVKNPKTLADSYQRKIKEILREKYPDLNKERIEGML